MNKDIILVICYRYQGLTKGETGRFERWGAGRKQGRTNSEEAGVVWARPRSQDVSVTIQTHALCEQSSHLCHDTGEFADNEIYGNFILSVYIFQGWSQDFRRGGMMSESFLGDLRACSPRNIRKFESLKWPFPAIWDKFRTRLILIFGL